VAILAGICVGVTDDVGVGVGDGQVAVRPLLVYDIVVDCVAVGAEDDASAEGYRRGSTTPSRATPP
jgi:hypothetical protein